MKTQMVLNLSGQTSSGLLDAIESVNAAHSNKTLTKGGQIVLTGDTVDIQFNLYSFNKIMNKLKAYIRTEPLDYMYHKRPKLYCFDKYMNVDLFDFIMYINSCFMTESFTMEQVKFLNADGAKLYMSLISSNKTSRIESKLDVFRNLD